MRSSRIRYRKRSTPPPSLFLLALIFAFSSGLAQEKTDAPIDIASRRELMLDDHLLDKLMGSAARKLHHPAKRDIVLQHDADWEGGGSNYHTVFQDGERYRLYYRGAGFKVIDGKLEQSHPQVTCYAESKDGIYWEKPNLGLFEWQGSRDNNIVLMDRGRSTHNFAPFKDTRPGVPDDQLYKAMAGHPDKKGLAAYASADGIRWRLLAEEPVITEGVFDSQNVAFWDGKRGEYRAYYRDFRDGFRDIRTSTSKDFLEWRGGDWLDYGDAPREHLYTNQIQPCPRAPHLFVGLPTRYVDRGWSGSMSELPDAENRQLRNETTPRYATSLTDLMLMSSRDGTNFHLWNEGFLWPGPERSGTWNYGHLYTACGLVQTSPIEHSIYAVEGAWMDARLRRYTLRIDGFASVHADNRGGELRTRPIVFAGKELFLNFATSAHGTIKVALQDIDYREIAGFGYGDSIGIFGDTIERKVSWRGDPDLSKLAGRPVRLRFVMREADLFSFQFR